MEHNGSFTFQSDSATLRALFIPEVLDNVLAFSSNDTCAKSTRVCRSWADVAKDHTWNTVDDLAVLFELLAPLVEKSETILGFDRKPSDADWARFAFYASSVKILTVRTDDDTVTIDEETLIEIALSLKPGGRLLPNLASLSIIFPLRPRSMTAFVKIFMNESLNYMTIWAINAASANVVPLLHDASRIRMLQSLQIFVLIDQGRSTVDKGFTDALCRCNYREIEMDMRSLSGECFNAIAASNSELQAMKAIWIYDPEDENILAPTSFIPHTFLTPASSIPFPSLTRLQLRLCTKGVENLFGGKAGYPSLTSLFLVISLFSDKGDLSKCMRKICSSCTKLEELTLHRYDNIPTHPSDANLIVIPTRSSLVTGLEAFYPVRDLPHLRSFIIRHYWPIRVGAEQLIDFVGWCPGLRHLSLNPEPVKHSPEDEDDVRLPLTVLPELARALPHLRDLQLFVDTSHRHVKRVGSPIIERFKNLQSLSFGTSVLPLGSKDWEETLLLMGKLLPSHCVLETSPILPAMREETGDVRKYEGYRQVWSKLKKELRLMHRLRLAIVDSVRSGHTTVENWDDEVSPEDK